ncbi:hypothetical protein [Paraglaciecola sp. L3A3]|uniref:glycosyl hydrolase family 95 catalytic domain-containing protein n=1 Tax=Paraglaciecola sp. L3A3 TaxID=2686358 RepID=UPI00131AA66C|nr:hypothetical protein [Paraglaciecola sp. L3A3]
MQQRIEPIKQLKCWGLLSVILLLSACVSIAGKHGLSEISNIDIVNEVVLDVNFGDFLAKKDLLWDRIPNRWELAPYTGNGNIGFLFYQDKSSPRNVISIYVGRHDYYDHRLPYEGDQLLWIYRGRLPLGHFEVQSKGNIQDVDLRLSLWNSEVTGTITTTKGSYQVRSLTHSHSDVIYFETDAKDEEITFSWHADVPYSSSRKTLDNGGGPKQWTKQRTAPYPLPPKATRSKSDNIEYSFQPLYQHRGETTVGWEVTGEASGKQYLSTSVHHSFPEKNSKNIVTQNLHQGRKMLADQSFFSSHQKWWHDYYPQSFLSLGEPEKEAFYWIQMYKLASASRGDGPILDLMGPWYHKTFWPMVWGDLNVQLIYWTHLTANRMQLGESLVNNVDKYHDNLTNNVPKHWKDSASVSTLFPQDMSGHAGGVVPDMLAWVLHDYWLHCVYAGDQARLRDGLYPILTKVVNSYFNYLKDNPVEGDNDGKFHFKNTWSPEYPGGWGQDINFTIALFKWSLETLLTINDEHNLNDPLVTKWQDTLARLPDFQIDENGLRIGKDIPFDKPHRHYSHLLPIYPLAQIDIEYPKQAKMARTSVDHWLDVTFNQQQKDKAMPVTGYTATGASSIYSTLGDAEKAYHYLNFFIQHKNVSPTTMYAEGNPVIESPLSYATSVHDMLLQSWGGKVRIFPASPKQWPDVAFHQFRTQGAFLVTAKKAKGITQFVELESLVGTPLVISPNISNPIIYIDGKLADKALVKQDESGFYAIDVAKGQRVLFMSPEITAADLVIKPQNIKKSQQNLFGLNDKTTRLPSHAFYYHE